MPQAFSIIVSIAAILMVGNLLILAHELGHYTAARSVGLVAERFTIGFGPNLFSVIDRRGTLWSLSALPPGGFVSFAGDRDRRRHRGYAALPPPARLAIIAAGPAANILVAIGLFAAILAVKGETTLLPVVSVVVPGSAADTRPAYRSETASWLWTARASRLSPSWPRSYATTPTRWSNSKSIAMVPSSVSPRVWGRGRPTGNSSDILAS